MEKDKIILCYFGTCSRAIKYTVNNHIENILNVLNPIYDIDIYVFNNNVEDSLIDNVIQNNDDVKLINSTYYEEETQSVIDNNINDYVKLHHITLRFRYDYTKSVIQNAMRQIYSEEKVGIFLEKHMDTYKCAIVCNPDCYLFNTISVNDVMNSINNSNIVYTTTVNDAQGYTNGFYIGSLKPMIKILKRYSVLSQLLPTNYDYEYILKQVFINNNIDRCISNVKFVKIRSNKDLPRPGELKLSLFNYYILKLSNTLKNMIKIRIFTDWTRPNEATKHFYLKTQQLLDDPDYNNKYIFTDDNDYTHAFIMNCAMPNIIHIPKENVIGLAQEPVGPKPFLGLTHQFVEYAKKHIGKYYIGSKGNLPEPFVEHFGYLSCHEPLKVITHKPKLMSIMISQKLFAPGHKYRHILMKKIIENGLPIDVYGRGCNLYNTSHPNFKGQFKSSELYDDYLFTICIENFSTPHYFSEKIINPLLRNTTPIYLGCQNINSYFPDNVICLSGNVDKDIELLKSICSEPNKYVKLIDGKKIMDIVSIKNVIKNWM